MAIRSLNRLRKIRNFMTGLRRLWYVYAKGIHIDPSVSISLSSRFEPGARNSIFIGPQTLVAFKTLLISRDAETETVRPIRIGRRCFIGGGSTILPGVTLGDESIVGAGSVVFEDVPSRCIVAGNPARVLRRDIEVGPYGRLAGADENSRRLVQVALQSDPTCKKQVYDTQPRAGI
ncbi:MAG: DapH/DapD/GlmU-related protein [Sphingobium sp.]